MYLEEMEGLMVRLIFIKRAGRTDPNADADDHGYPWGAVAERFQRVDCDVTAVPAHSCQSDTGGLDRHLGKTGKHIHDLQFSKCVNLQRHALRFQQQNKLAESQFSSHEYMFIQHISGQRSPQYHTNA